MSKLDSLTRRLEKLEAATRAQHTPASHVVIFYDMDRPDKDAWIQAEIERVFAGQEMGYLKTIFLMPEKETPEDNAAHYAAMREDRR